MKIIARTVHTEFWATRHRNNALGQEVRSIMRLAIGNDGQNSNAEELFTSARLPTLKAKHEI